MKFYLILLAELVLSPYLYARNVYKKYFAVRAISKKKTSEFAIRRPVHVPIKVRVCIHEWGGYAGKRKKKIKNYLSFECGLDYQIERFSSYKGRHDLDVQITMSDKALRSVDALPFTVIGVSNKGMDFSGYASFLRMIEEEPNAYVILTNTSVHMAQSDFIDDYIDFMEKNPDVGMLGTSYCTKEFQTLIRNNFKPHLQSFFLLTTTSVLKEVKAKNRGKFPGEGISDKLLLIRKGEVLLSGIVLSLNYRLACILDDGKPIIFDKNCLIDNGRSSWKASFGDYRKVTHFPNMINPMQN